MMPRRVSVRRLHLDYAGGLVLHTASSGSVLGLTELRLVVERDDTLEAIGASRTNIAYLSGHPAEVIETAILREWGAFTVGISESILVTEAGAPLLAEALRHMAGGFSSSTLQMPAVIACVVHTVRFGPRDHRQDQSGKVGATELLPHRLARQ